MRAEGATESRPIPVVTNLAGLGLLVWGTATQIAAHRGRSGEIVGGILLAVAVGGWLGWVGRRSGTRTVVVAGWLVLMALSGGGLVAVAPLGMVFPAVGALGAAIRWPIREAVGVAVAGWSALAVGTELGNQPRGLVGGGLAAVGAGTMIGYSRRQATTQASMAAASAVLEERNRIGRDIHDVLAHTLAALSLQIEALATVIEREGASSEAIEDQLVRSRGLVREGMEEARHAVGALRGEGMALSTAIDGLCRQKDLAWEISGEERSLPMPVWRALFGVAQEGITNAIKHAGGATIEVGIAYGADNVEVWVRNDAGARPTMLAETGGGQGLAGVKERMEEVGGELTWGREGDGWCLRGRVRS